MVRGPIEIDTKMRNSHSLPVRFPVGTKYVLEGRGQSIRRYVEFPDGHRVQLRLRKRFVARAQNERKREAMRTECELWRH